ncbi:atherin-like [Odontomachus brunneus]|uniref:atherin-like n=1 Tax=Odontomachus brunneus TaxID=486640 RepID=UPI0013F1810F|nr:atherin-like [Odontomachus brunneus]
MEDDEQTLRELIRPMSPEEANATWQHLLAGAGAREATPAQARAPPVGAPTRRPAPRVGTSTQRSRDADERKLLALAGYAPPPATERPRGQPHVRPVGWATSNRPPATLPTSARPGPRVFRVETPRRRVVLRTPPGAPHAARRAPARIEASAPPPTTPQAPPPPAAKGGVNAPRHTKDQKTLMRELFGSDSSGSSREPSPTTRTLAERGSSRPSPSPTTRESQELRGPRRTVTLPDGTQVTVTGRPPCASGPTGFTWAMPGGFSTSGRKPSTAPNEPGPNLARRWCNEALLPCF